ncbi:MULTISPECIES: FCD domain-containing protein [unclassified Mesorhizobium]|uniref:FCD domain-containing protein n=1 Tax=unclassified Mesorhizobium TaxID=325217 RepID=UPI00333B17A5
MEGDVAAEAASRQPPPARRPAANLRYQSTAVAADHRNGLYQLDVEFHQLLTQYLGLDHVGETLGSLRLHLERVRRMPEDAGGPPSLHPGRASRGFRSRSASRRRRGPPCAITSTIPPLCWNSSPGKIPPFSDRKNAPGGHRRRARAIGHGALMFACTGVNCGAFANPTGLTTFGSIGKGHKRAPLCLSKM